MIDPSFSEAIKEDLKNHIGANYRLLTRCVDLLLDEVTELRKEIHILETQIDALKRRTNHDYE